MNVLPREKQIEVIAALCDGLGIRAVSRITGVNRGTVGALRSESPGRDVSIRSMDTRHTHGGGVDLAELAANATA